MKGLTFRGIRVERPSFSVVVALWDRGRGGSMHHLAGTELISLAHPRPYLGTHFDTTSPDRGTGLVAARHRDTMSKAFDALET